MNARVPPHALQPALALERVSQAWDNDIVRQLTDYIAIPAKSPMFSPDWAEQGLLDTVVRNAAAWVESQKVEGLTLEIVRLEGRTPVLFFEIDATQAGFMVSSALFGMMFGNVMFGALADRYGRKLVIAICIAVFSIFTAAAGWADDPIEFSVR